jgi:hypothetical protein
MPVCKRPRTRACRRIRPDWPRPNQIRYTGTQITIPMLTEPTSVQREAFSLLGTAIPLTLK